MFRILSLVLIMTVFHFGTVALAGPTKAEFREEIIEHHDRVQKNVLHIFNNFPELFPNLMSLPLDVRLSFIKIYSQTHDAPKLMKLTELQELGYKGEKTFFEKLYSNWGLALKRRPPFIQELNIFEDLHKNIIMIQNFGNMERELYQKLLKEVAYMEFIADETDAKLFRGPELGVEVKPFDAENMFRYFYKDEVAAKISRWLEVSVYKRVDLIFCEAHFKSAP